MLLQLKEVYKKGNECIAKVRRNERHSERGREDIDEDGERREKDVGRELRL